MKRTIIALAVLAGFVLAQAWDFEAGKEFHVSQNTHQQSWYFLARYNLPLSSEVLGTRLWALPEVGIWVPDSKPYYGYFRLQFLVDQTFGTLFVDSKYNFSPVNDDVSVRVGVRFGWPP